MSHDTVTKSTRGHEYHYNACLVYVHEEIYVQGSGCYVGACLMLRGGATWAPPLIQTMTAASSVIEPPY